MKRTSKRLGLSMIIAGAALALATTPAQAAGTVHYDYPEQCYNYYDYYYGYTTVCSSSSGQYNDTVTPSGNESYSGKGTSDYSVSNAYFSYTDSYDYKIHFLFKKGETQVDHENYSDTYTVNGTTCTFTDNYTFANGELRHDKATNSCS